MSENRENRVPAGDFYIVMEWNAAESMRLKGFRLQVYLPNYFGGEWVDRNETTRPCQKGALYRLKPGQGAFAADALSKLSEPAKEFERIPLEYADVPVGAAFSADPRYHVFYPESVNLGGVTLAGEFKSFKQLADENWKVWRGQGWYDCWK